MSRRLPLLVLLAVAALGASSASARPRAVCQAAEPGRNLVLISARTGTVSRSFPDADGGGASVVLADGQGGWFAAGSFTCIGHVPTDGLVHLHPDGTLDTAWSSALPPEPGNVNGYATVMALARSGSTLYAGGDFGVEALDAATGASRWLTPVTGRQGVFALAAAPRAVYAGGDFGTVGGTPRRALVALAPADGRILPWHTPVLRGGAPPITVIGLALAGGVLYVGGNSIRSVDGRARPGFAALDAATGSLTPWIPGRPGGLDSGGGVGDVETILVSHGAVFTAGHDGFGIVSTRTGKLVRWGLGLSGYRFAAAGPTAYLAGNCRNSFAVAGGQTRNNLVAIDMRTHRVTAWNPHVNRYVCVSSIAASTTRVLLAGSFTQSLG